MESTQMDGSQIPDDMMEEITAFSKEADGIVDSFTKKLVQPPAPSIIYHYTDDAGLRGIIETGTLWFTDVLRLNDPSELRHGLKPVIDFVDQEAAERPELKQLPEVFDYTLNSHTELAANYFVCCFSRAGDDLGQWRAYADNGRGYAIGFDADELVKAFSNNSIPESKRSAFSVSYSEVELREMYRPILEKAKRMISPPGLMDLPDETKECYFRELSAELLLPTLRPALLFKDMAYYNEQEYRFLQVFQAGVKVPDLKYRNRPNSLIRYLEFDWRNVAPKSLKKIRIGPAADERLGRQFAESCVREFSPTRRRRIEIDQSTIPYRA